MVMMLKFFHSLQHMRAWPMVPIGYPVTIVKLWLVAHFMIDKHLYGILTAVKFDYTEMMDTFIIIFMVTDRHRQFSHTTMQFRESFECLFKCSKELSFTKDWSASITFNSRRCYL